MADEEKVASEGAASDEAEKSSQVEEESQDLETEEQPPGGTDGTAVYARKEHAKVKKLSAEIQAEREKRIALEARIQTLQEVAQRRTEQAPVIEPPKRISSADAWKKFDAGEWTREAVTEYIADSRYLEHEANRQAQERANKEILEPVEEAKKEAIEYTRLIPTLVTRSHPKSGEIDNRVNFLLTKGGVRTRFQAERLAFNEILGSIDEIKERQKVNNARPTGDAHVETRGAGSGFQPGNKKDAYSDIPDHVKELWDKFRTSEKDRATEAKLYREKHPMAGGR